MPRRCGTGLRPSLSKRLVRVEGLPRPRPPRPPEEPLPCPDDRPRPAPAALPRRRRTAHPLRADTAAAARRPPAVPRPARPAGRRDESAAGPDRPRPRTATGSAALHPALGHHLGEDANLCVAPRLGLPALPVLDEPEDDGPDDDGPGADPARGARLHWKTRPIVDRAAGRPFAWVDDEISAADRVHVAAHHPGPALLHRVDPARGLTDADLEAIGAWLQTA
ncbi:hypothetical protein GCM10025734_55090 [Kitasatospora paranensis]